MRRFVSICILLVVTGCGKQSAQLTTHEFDAELAKYRDEFLATATANGRKDLGDVFVAMQAGIVTTETGEPAAGVCEKETVPTITVDAARWPSLTGLQKRALVYHELGHCLLGRAHLEGTRDDYDCAVSLMAATQPIQSCLFLLKSDYDKELFSGI